MLEILYSTFCRRWQWGSLLFKEVSIQSKILVEIIPVSVPMNINFAIYYLTSFHNNCIRTHYCSRNSFFSWAFCRRAFHWMGSFLSNEESFEWTRNVLSNEPLNLSKFVKCTKKMMYLHSVLQSFTFVYLFLFFPEKKNKILFQRNRKLFLVKRLRSISVNYFQLNQKCCTNYHSHLVSIIRDRLT